MHFAPIASYGSGIKAIRVDVSQMSYVSSAGLRVLLMMCKSLENMDNFEMVGIGKEVREILETTGFDQIFPGMSESPAR